MKGNAIYHLIVNLDRTEKAYFKKFGYKYDKGEVKASLVLFDVIDKLGKKQDEIDASFERKVKTAFMKKADNGNFIKTKNALYVDLSTVLIDYDGKLNFKTIALNEYLRVEVLMRRNLFDAAKKIVLKVIKQIEARGENELSLLFSSIYLKLGIRLNNKQDIDLATSNRLQTLQNLSDLQHIAALYEEVYQLHRQLGVQGAEENRKDINDLGNQIAKLNTNNKSHSYLFNYYSLQKLIGYIKQDFDLVINSLEQMVELIELHPQLFQGKELAIIATYSDLIYHSLERNDTSKYLQYFDSFNAIVCESMQSQNYLKAQLLKINLFYQLSIQDYKEIAKLHLIFDEQKDAVNPHLRNSLSSNLVYGYFCDRKWKECLRVLFEQIDFNSKTEKRADIALQSELLLLVIHFEEGNFDLLNNLLRSLKSRFEKTVLSQSHVKPLIEFFQVISSGKFSDPKRAAQKGLEQLDSSGYVAPHNAFNCFAWFHSIQQDKPYTSFI